MCELLELLEERTIVRIYLLEVVRKGMRLRMWGSEVGYVVLHLVLHLVSSYSIIELVTTSSIITYSSRDALDGV